MSEERPLASPGALSCLPVPDQSLVHICRFCVHAATQWSQGRKRCQRRGCGGPSRGKAYPEYQGPLEASYRASHCMVCGGAAELTVELQGQLPLGICRKHLHVWGIEQDVPIAPEDRGHVVSTEKKLIPLQVLWGLAPPEKEPVSGQTEE